MMRSLPTRLVLWTALLAAGLSLASMPAALAADDDTPEEPARSGPVLTIPVSTEDDAFAMVLVGGVAPQPRIGVGSELEIDAQFAGSAIDPEVCVALEGVGCIGTLSVEPGTGLVAGFVEVPADIAPGLYAVTFESTNLGVVELGTTTIEVDDSAAAPAVTTEAAETPDETTTENTAQDVAGGPAVTPTANRLTEEERTLLIGAAAVLVIGLIALRYKRRKTPKEPQARGDRLSNLELPTATQLPDRAAERTGAVAVRTHRLEPGEGFVVVALRRGEDGVSEDEIARYGDLDTAMQGARAEAAENGRSDVMWWEVRKNGSSLPVWLIEGNVTPVASGGLPRADGDDAEPSA